MSKKVKFTQTRRVKNPPVTTKIDKVRRVKNPPVKEQGTPKK